MSSSRIVSKVEQQAHEILGRVKHVVLGLSGGADSVALLRLLLRSGLTVEAIHCNFHLRGEEADRDMIFCEQLCSRLQIPLDIVHFDVARYAVTHHVGTEEACRDLRYNYFRERLLATGAERIAVAHHADDNIETLLLNLFRGSGITGLRGMLPDAHGVIRPLLTSTRAEILAYLDALQQDYIIDSSNLDTDYRRNFIRNELLPAIESRWTGVRKSIGNTLSNLRSDAEALQALSERELGNLSDKNELSYRQLRESGCAEWLLHQWLTRYGAKANVAREIAAQLRNGRPANGKRWLTPSGTIAASRRALHFIPNESDN